MPDLIGPLFFDPRARTASALQPLYLSSSVAELAYKIGCEDRSFAGAM